jgi:hypothetical protein
MSTELEMDSLARAVRDRRHRDGLAKIMGQSTTGIVRARQLVLELDQLDPADVASLRAWCAQPMPELSIIPEHRGVLEDLAAHEFGHLVAARALGFKTGDISLVLTSMGGSHTGTIEIIPDEVTPDMATVMDYLQRRAMVHFAGMLAQWPEPLKQGHVVPAIQEERGESDRQKALELIRVMLNIKGDVTDEGHARAMVGLAVSANILVTQNFPIIRALAARFAANIRFYGQTYRWAAAEIEAQPEIASIVVPQRTQKST